MKSTELNQGDLRVGNFVLGSVGNLVECKIHNISNANQYQPILLTEEWHNNFGVKKNGKLSFEYELPRKNNMSTKIVFNGDYVMIRQGLGGFEDDIIALWNKDLTKRDMYVHEWQNLYFALTNEELLWER